MNRNEYENIKKYLNGEITRENYGEEEYEERKKLSKGIIVKNDKLYWKNKKGKELRMLKEDEIDSVIFMSHNHETGGHLGTEAVYGKIVERFYWKGMYNSIREYIKRCDTCQRRGSKGGKGYLNPISIGEPFERIGLDFVGPLPRTKEGNKYILVMTDYLTKWPEAE